MQGDAQQHRTGSQCIQVVASRKRSQLRQIDFRLFRPNDVVLLDPATQLVQLHQQQDQQQDGHHPSYPGAAKVEDADPADNAIAHSQVDGSVGIRASL